MRELIRSWLDIAVEAADPRRLTAEALDGLIPETRTVIAVGKAAPAMCLGAADALGRVQGLCVAAGPSEVPDGVELLIGDHPVPGKRSFEAGRRVLDSVSRATSGSIVLVSGGGSALCEWPRPGIDPAYVENAYKALLRAGLSITETNLARGHLSAIKCGGLLRATPGPIDTYILSDVGEAGPEVVASGPTLPMRHDPENARRVLELAGLEVPGDVWKAITRVPETPTRRVTATVLGGGMTAARAVADAASAAGIEARVAPAWLSGGVKTALDRLFAEATNGITVATGEAVLEVKRPGRGGRNTHAALLAAERIADTDSIFAAFATDGVDGAALAAGAIVDGATLRRGGDPSPSLEAFDSADYLEATGDLIVTGATGTNVADLWLLWRP